MNKNVNPVLAVIIIALFGSLLWLKFHFYGKALDVPKVAFLKEAPDKTVFFRLGSKLYQYQNNGMLKRTIDLQKLGINGNSGDFDFFSNGDLLINSDEYHGNLKENLAAYARVENTTTAPAKEGKGLLRCKLTQPLAQQNCQVFNKTIPELQGPHYIHIDRKTDEVYLADTTRHEIRKLSPSGKLLAEMTTGLKFPNQVFLERSNTGSNKGKKLWVVDTNHHAMKAVKAETEHFGDLIEKHKTTLDGEWIWPSAFSKLSNGWAVQIADNAMQNAKIVLYNNQWQQGSALNLPVKADPVSSIFTNDTLIIADANNYTLYQFDQYGRRLSNFAENESSPGIYAALQANKALDRQYQQWSSWVLYLGLGLFALLFIYALKQSVKDQAEQEEEAIQNSQQIEKDKIIRLAKLPMEGEWIEAKPYYKITKWIILGIDLVLVALLIYLIFKLDNKVSLELILMVLIFPAIITISIIPISKISQYQIGFFKNNVTIKTDKGKLISAPYNQIKWGSRFFSIGDWFIPIGNPKQSIFPYEKLQKMLMPYVSPENKLGEIDAFKLQWKSPEGILKYALISIGLGLLLIIILKRHQLMGH